MLETPSVQSFRSFFAMKTPLNACLLNKHTVLTFNPDCSSVFDERESVTSVRACAVATLCHCFVGGCLFGY